MGLLLALTGLMQLLELLEVTNDVLNRHLGFAGVLHYAALRTPSELLVALPLAGLLGSMAAFYAMARGREITALRASGVGLWRLLLYLLPVPILFAALHIALAAEAGTAGGGRIEVVVGFHHSAGGARVRSAVGAYQSRHPAVRAQQRRWAAHAGRAYLYTRRRGPADADHACRRGALEANHWRLTGARDLQETPGSWTPGPAERDWDSNLSPEDVAQLEVADPPPVHDGDRRCDRRRSCIHAAGSYYRTVLLQSFVAPFTVFIMMLLAMPAAIVSERGGGGGRMLLALFFGLGFLLVDGIFSSFGTSGRISPQLAATAAPAAFALLGLLQLWACEHA